MILKKQVPRCSEVVKHCSLRLVAQASKLSEPFVSDDPRNSQCWYYNLPSQVLHLQMREKLVFIQSVLIFLKKYITKLELTYY